MMNKRIMEIWNTIKKRQPTRKALEIYREAAQKIKGQ